MNQFTIKVIKQIHKESEKEQSKENEILRKDMLKMNRTILELQKEVRFERRHNLRIEKHSRMRNENKAQIENEKISRSYRKHKVVKQRRVDLHSKLKRRLEAKTIQDEFQQQYQQFLELKPKFSEKYELELVREEVDDPIRDIDGHIRRRQLNVNLRRHYDKFQNGFFEYKVIPESLDVSLPNAFKEAIDNTIEEKELVEGDFVRLILQYSYNHTYNNSTSLLRIGTNAYPDLLLNELKGLSEKVYFKDEQDLEALTISVHYNKIPHGMGGSTVLCENNFLKKKSKILIKNDDTMCMARCLVTAKAIQNSHKYEEKDLKALKRSQPYQETLAKKLHKKVVF